MKLGWEYTSDLSAIRLKNYEKETASKSFQIFLNIEVSLMGLIQAISIVMLQDVDQLSNMVIKWHAMTNVPCLSSSTKEFQWQVSAGAAGAQMIQGSSKARDSSGSFSSFRKKY